MRSRIFLLLVSALLFSLPARAALIWSMEFLDLPAVISPTDTVVVRALLKNSASSTENLGVIGGFQGNPPGFDYEIGGFANIPNPTPIQYDFQFGPEFVGNVTGALSDQFEGVDLAPGEDFEFVYMMFRPKGAEVLPGVYSFSGELQLFVASPPVRPYVGGSGDSISWTVSAFTSLLIDIKPGSDPNAINPLSRQNIAVAILTTKDFDATQVDVASVTFGPGNATESHERAHIEDVDGDGDMDLVLHFRVGDAGITCGDTEATLSGQTYAGEPVSGSDSIVTVNCP